jgi:HAD superfamily hydrolase (TIGR01509 family)
MPKALLFDFDGVIVMSEEARFKIMQRIAHEHGLNMPDEYFKKLEGTTTRNFFAKYFHSIDDEQRDQIITEYSAEFKDKIVDHAVPIHDTNEFIKNYDGDLIMAVVSGNDNVVIERMLEHLGLRQYFNFVLGKQDVTAHKPDPTVYLMAAQRLGVDPVDCICIEDSVSGATAGTAAGMAVYIFLNGLNDQSEFDHLPVKSFVRTTQDIEDILR